MIRTVLNLRVVDGREDEVVEYYRKENILQFSLDHSEAFRSELSVALDGSGVVLVTW
jgi:hypothetical protein